MRSLSRCPGSCLQQKKNSDTKLNEELRESLSQRKFRLLAKAVSVISLESQGPNVMRGKITQELRWGRCGEFQKRVEISPFLSLYGVLKVAWCQLYDENGHFC